MIYKIIIYLVLCCGIFFIPSQIIDKFATFAQESKNKFKHKLKSFTLFEFWRGKELLFSFVKIESMYLSGKINTELNFVEYKFYTQLITRLISLSKTHGISLKKTLTEIKNTVANDISYEQKIFDEIINGIFQFLLVSFVTWIFVFLSKSLVNIEVSKLIFISMISLQIFGLILFFVITSKIKNKYFNPYVLTFSELYVFISEFELGISINQTLFDSQILSGEFSTNKQFRDLFEHFLSLLDRLKNNGISPSNDVHLIINNIWEDRSQKLSKFHKHLSFIKFLHLALIYLPVYFLYMACIFKFFMEQ